MRTPEIRLFLVGESKTVGMGVERSMISSEKSLSVAGFIKDSDSVRGFGALVSTSRKDQELYSRSWMWTLYRVVIFAFDF